MANRELKFRAWRKRDCIMCGPLTDLVFIKDGLIGCNYAGGSIGIQGQPHNDCIIMQYTGLKDKNGIEVCEGDIVSVRIGFGTRGKHPKKKGEYIFVKGIVEYRVSQPCGDAGFNIIYPVSSREEMFQGNSTDRYRVQYGFRDCEIIGNIYEHPDLLPTPTT